MVRQMYFPCSRQLLFDLVHHLLKDVKLFDLKFFSTEV